MAVLLDRLPKNDCGVALKPRPSPHCGKSTRKWRVLDCDQTNYLTFNVSWDRYQTFQQAVNALRRAP